MSCYHHLFDLSSLMTQSMFGISQKIVVGVFNQLLIFYNPSVMRVWVATLKLVSTRFSFELSYSRIFWTFHVILEICLLDDLSIPTNIGTIKRKQHPS